jgi:putative nucleotidyltransferase with HDIG domain
MSLLKQRIAICNCRPGMLLAEDIIYNGSKLVSRNTVFNSYIIKKLMSLGEYSVCVYDPVHDNALNKYNDTIESFQRDYMEDVHLIKKVIEELTVTSKVNHDYVMSISQSIFKYLDEGNAIIKCLNSLKKADEYTYTHCINVAIYSMMIAKWMNLSLESIKEIIQSGLIHDIGKIKIPIKILNKPGKLTEEEFYEIKKHTVLGYDLVNEYKDFNKNIRNTVLMHHERIDGSGYPFGFTEKDIPLSAKIVSVADVFDAMTSNRIYKKGTTPFKALEMFMIEGLKQYDRSVVFALLGNITPYYTGMKVTLEDGRLGEIMYIPPNDILYPVVKVDNELIDLSREINLSISNIFSYVE